MWPRRLLYGKGLSGYGQCTGPAVIVRVSSEIIPDGPVTRALCAGYDLYPVYIAHGRPGASGLRSYAHVGISPGISYSDGRG